MRIQDESLVAVLAEHQDHRVTVLAGTAWASLRCLTCETNIVVVNVPAKPWNVPWWANMDFSEDDCFHDEYDL